MLTDCGEPLLIEVNSSPATGTSTKLDVEVKFELLSDLLHLVGVNCNVEDGQIIMPTRCQSVEEADLKRRNGVKTEGIHTF